MIDHWASTSLAGLALFRMGYTCRQDHGTKSRPRREGDYVISVLLPLSACYSSMSKTCTTVDVRPPPSLRRHFYTPSLLFDSRPSVPCFRYNARTQVVQTLNTIFAPPLALPHWLVSSTVPSSLTPLFVHGVGQFATRGIDLLGGYFHKCPRFFSPFRRPMKAAVVLSFRRKYCCILVPVI